MKTYKHPLFVIVILLIINSSFSSCSGDDASSSSNKKTINYSESNPLFTELDAKKTGISFSNNLIDDPLDVDRNVMSFDNYFNGGGVAIGDINNDGLQDVFFVGNEVGNKLYLNKGDMQFEDISKSAKINEGKNWATGVTMADVNADGWMDIYVCQSSNFNRPASERENRLYINNKDNTFKESAKQYGLDDNNLSHGAAFWDYDNDGDLDCYVMNSSRYVRIPLGKVLEHLDSDIKYVKEASGKLFRNDGGKYTDVTEGSGMLHYGFGHNIVVSDINKDGWLDLYVTNDYSVPDFMFINQKDGTFKDEIKERTDQITFYGMGVDIADINNDAHQEIAVVDMAADDHIRDKTLMASMNIEAFWIYVNQLKYQVQYMFNTLQLNNGDGKYSNIAHMSGVGKTDWSWAVLLADYDNDGFNDYYVTNGFRRYARDNDSRRKMKKIREENNGNVPNEMRKKLYDELPQMKLPNLIFQNDGDLHFVNKTKEWGIGTPSYSNGASYGDLDNDGDLDLIVSNVDDLAFVYENNSKNNYIRFKLKGTSNASPTIGTSVKLVTGDNVQYREYGNTRGYRGAVEAGYLHFGLGNISKVDRVEIKWPSGKTQVLENVKSNQLVVLEESKASSSDLLKKSVVSPFFIAQDEVIEFTHKESEYDDFALEVLIPHKQSTLGPFIAKGDVNNDGMEDVYIGGAAGQAGQLMIQQKNGKFINSSSSTFVKDAVKEDQGALFFDYDKDGDMDLYVVSGTTEFKANSPNYRDRLYQNDGKGKFTKTKGKLPEINANGSKVKAADYDNDGDLDLFVGARGIPQKYPYADHFQLLKNEGGKFVDVSKAVANEISNKYMINDFVWTDFNGDKTMDLITLGEWSSIQFYANKDGKFVDVTKEKLDPTVSKGWWYSMTLVDVDNDGDQDIVCGNVGPNTKFKASQEKPFTIFADDFDKNGTCDVVLSEDYKGELVPTRGRQCSSEQMPFISDKFKDYKSFAAASVEDIFGDDIKNALQLEATTFNSVILINDGGKYNLKNLPSGVQVSPINGIVAMDINKDGNMDLVVAGNKYNVEVETPRYDASKGYVMLGDGKGNFEVSSTEQSGLNIDYNTKDLMEVKTEKGSLLLAANNNDKLKVYSIK